MNQIKNNGFVVYGYNPEMQRVEDHGGYSPLLPLPIDTGSDMQVRVVPFKQYAEYDEDGNLVLKKMWLNKKGLKDRMEHIRSLICRKEVVGGYVTSKAVVLTIDRKAKSGGWLEWLKDLGIQFKMSTKMMKRLKPVLGFHLGVGIFDPSDVRVGIDENPNNERVLDGALQIRKSLVEKVYAEYQGTEGKEERNALHRHMIETAHGHRFRMVHPCGMVKGHAFVVPDDNWIHGDCDIFTHRANVKDEIWWEQGVAIGLDPLVRKSRAHFNLQYGLNIPDLREKLPEYISQYFEDLRVGMKERKVFDSQDDLARALVEMEEYMTHSHFLQIRCNARFLIETGHGFEHSKYIRDQFLHSKTQLFKSVDETDKIPLEIPHSDYAQVISLKQAQNCGIRMDETDIEFGQVAYVHSLDSFVVRNGTWHEMFGSHDTPDQDDYFSIFWRKWEGKVYGICVRTPNYIGQYTILHPTPALGVKLGDVPECDPATLPPRFGDEVKAGRIKLLPLPKVQPYPGHCSRDYIWTQAQKVMSSKLSPGGYINLTMLNTLATGKALPEMYSPSDVVDRVQQEGSAAGMNEVMEFARAVGDDILQAGIPIDRVFAKRFDEEDFPFVTEEGWISRAKEQIRQEIEYTERWVEENIELECPPEFLTLQGKYRQDKLAEIERIFRDFRRIAREIGTTANSKAWKEFPNPIHKSQRLLVIRRYSSPRYSDLRAQIQKTFELAYEDKAKEAIRCYAMMVHCQHWTDEEGNPQPYSDYLLMSNNSKGEGLWKYVSQLLMGR